MKLSLEEPKLSHVQNTYSARYRFLCAGAGAIASLWLWAAFFRGRAARPLQLFGLAATFSALLLLRKWGEQFLRRNDLPAEEGAKAVSFGFSGLYLFGVFLPEYLFGDTVPPLMRSVLLGTVCLALCASIFRQALRPRGKPSAIPRSGALLVFFCIVYFALTTTFALAKLRAFGYVGQDIAYFTQCLYTALHGKLFYSNLYHDLLYSRPVYSDFAGHNQIALFLFLPFYALHRAASTLLVLRNVLIVLCAWPAYLISRRFLSPQLAALIAIAFLLTPAVIYQNVYDFAPLSIGALPLLFTFYFFLEGRFSAFLVAAIATQFVREDMVFALFGIGLLAVWQRRSPKWSAFPVAISVAWALFSWKIVFPHFLDGSSSAVNGCFSYLGATPGQILASALHHPGTLASRQNLVYAKQLLDPFGGVLFLLSPAWLASLPYLIINILAQGGGCNTAMIYRHYAIVPTVLLFVSFLMSLEWVSKRLASHGKDPILMQRTLVGFALSFAFCSLVFVSGQEQVRGVRAQAWHVEARHIAGIVPNDASVAAPRYLLPALANRNELYQSLRLLEYHHPRAEYIIIDKNWSRMTATDQWRPNYTTLETFLSKSRNYTVVYSSDGYLVYRRCLGCTTDLPRLAVRGANE